MREYLNRGTWILNAKLSPKWSVRKYLIIVKSERSERVLILKNLFDIRFIIINNHGRNKLIKDNRWKTCFQTLTWQDQNWRTIRRFNWCRCIKITVNWRLQWCNRNSTDDNSKWVELWWPRLHFWHASIIWVCAR